MTSDQERNRGQIYGAIAFTSVILTCYSQYFFVGRYHAKPWQVVVSFLLGGAYGAVAILGNRWAESDRPRFKFAYFATLCAILTATIWVTPIRGFFGIIVLPVVSQAIFDLTWKGAVLVGAYLFAVSTGVFGILYGAAAMGEAAISYLAAFAFTIVFTVITTQAQRARLTAERLRADLETANAQLRAHAAQTEELATTRERNRLAREIHDGVGHYLTVIKVQLDAAAALLPAQPGPAAESVTKAARLAGEALDDVRHSVVALRTDAKRPPLTDALRQLATDAAPVPALRIEGAPRPLPSAAEHALYRTAQEGLTNLRKHAAATSAELTLDYRDAARVRLALLDNGRGAASAHTPSALGGYGLRGLRERVELLGGKLTAANRPEGGFALTVEVPA